VLARLKKLFDFELRGHTPYAEFLKGYDPETAMAIAVKNLGEIGVKIPHIGRGSNTVTAIQRKLYEKFFATGQPLTLEKNGRNRIGDAYKIGRRS
jgi:hypothetical protein